MIDRRSALLRCRFSRPRSMKTFQEHDGDGKRCRVGKEQTRVIPRKRAGTGHSPPPQCRWSAFENPQFRWEPQTCEKPKFQEAYVGSLRVLCWFAKRTAPCRTWQRLDRPKPNTHIVAPRSSSGKSTVREKGDRRSQVGHWRHSRTANATSQPCVACGDLMIP